MVFKHMVKYNGEYYPPGTEVPMGEEKTVVEDKTEKETTMAEKPIKRGRPTKN